MEVDGSGNRGVCGGSEGLIWAVCGEGGNPGNSTAWWVEGSDTVLTSWLTLLDRSFISALRCCGGAGEALSSSCWGDREMMR